MVKMINSMLCAFYLNEKKNMPGMYNSSVNQIRELTQDHRDPLHLFQQIWFRPSEKQGTFLLEREETRSKI